MDAVNNNTTTTLGSSVPPTNSTTAATTMTTGGIKPLRKAVPVPATDLRSALTAIENDAARLHVQLNSNLNPYNNQSSSISSSQLTPEEHIILQAKLDANASLRSNIVRLCRPVDDAVHEETLQAVREELGMGYPSDCRGDRGDDGSDVWDDVDSDYELDSLSSDEDDDEEEEEIDESELLDQDAVSRVRALREEVRTLSDRVGRKMDEVTGRAVALAGREIEGMRTLADADSRGAAGEDGDGKDNATDVDGGTNDPFSDHGGDAQADLSDSNARRIDAMKSTLSSLSESISKLELGEENGTKAAASGGGGGTASLSSLPTAVSDLQVTVDTVAAALAKSRLRRDVGDDMVLSQTERAILAKPERERGVGGEGGEDDIRTAEARARIAGMSPEERFSAFMESTGGGGGAAI
mmetsp:Transcript_37665/g.82072  ORF Transcript_37665/g.82072 Transcript_37665/m.82072 type:complete len:411 (+) Transcript_37665:212-1444(+)